MTDPAASRSRQSRRRPWLRVAVVGGLLVLGGLGWRAQRAGRPQVAAPALPSPAPAEPAPTRPPWREGLIAVDLPEDDGRAIVLLPIEASDPTEASEGRRLAGGFEALAGLRWSPDGAWLAFAARVEDNWDIYRIRRDGEATERLTRHRAYDGAPAWSPDGSSLAFETYRDDDFEIYRLALDAADADGAALRVSQGPGPDLEPTWLSDGRLLWSSWSEDRFLLDGPALGNWLEPVASTLDGDARRPQASAAGHRLAWIDASQEASTLRLLSLDEPGRPSAPRRLPISARVRDFAWSPDGQALALISAGRGKASLELTGLDGRDRVRLASLPADAGAIAWTAGAMPEALAPWPLPPAADGSAADPAPPSADPELRAGLVRLADVEAPGARMNAALVDDLEALRAEIRDATGRDFMGTMSDMWRPLGYTGSSFFSWHKTGRAFDFDMNFQALDGGTGMVIVRETGSRPLWRIYLRAASQDGSDGAPLRDPGWDFYARFGDDPVAAREGGRRQARIASGYYIDFTAQAARHGWQRIASITRAGQDWRSDWYAIDYWHFERRDGLSWFDAARQAYSDEELAAELSPERLRLAGQSARAHGRVGVPRDLAGSP